MLEELWSWYDEPRGCFPELELAKYTQPVILKQDLGQGLVDPIAHRPEVPEGLPAWTVDEEGPRGVIYGDDTSTQVLDLVRDVPDDLVHWKVDSVEQGLEVGGGTDEGVAFEAPALPHEGEEESGKAPPGLRLLVAVVRLKDVQMSHFHLQLDASCLDMRYTLVNSR